MKKFLCVITQDSPQAIDLMTKETWSHFDGLFIVDHSRDASTYEVVKDRIGMGQYIKREFYNHTGHSMNDWLLNPNLPVGSWCWINDTNELCNPDFTKNIDSFIAQLEQANINSVYSYGKLFFFKKHEHQFFNGSPHWGLVNVKPMQLDMQTVPQFADKPELYRFNNRPNVREPSHFIDHFVKYYLWDSSNHLLVDTSYEDFLMKEELRYRFKQYLINQLGFSIPLKVDDLKSYLQNNELTYMMKSFLNQDRILTDFYRFHVLKHSLEQIKEDHKNKINFQL